MHLQLLDEITATNGAPAAVAATGSMTTVAAASIVHAETFVLCDGNGHACRFIFDLGTADIADPPYGIPQVLVDISGATSSDDVRDAVITAINGAPIGITASANGTATVALVNDTKGSHGNQPMNETVANATFAVSGMEDGEMDGQGLGRYKAAEDGAEEGAWLKITATCSAGELGVSGRLWVYSHQAQSWFVLVKVNGGGSLDEAAAGALTHTEYIAGLRTFERAYLEIEDLTGVDATVSAWLQTRR